jgi:type II secretory pathway component GspD/PulD (secretin)
MTGASSIAGRTAGLVTAALVWLPAGADARQPADIAVVRLDAIYGSQSSPASSYPIARLDDGEQGADLDRIRAGSMTFAQPMPVRDVLLLLFRGTPFSVVLDPGVNGSFIGELSELSLRQALEAVLASAGLDYRRQGRVVQIFPPRIETRLFEVGHLDIRRSWRRTAGGRRPDSPGDVTSTVQSDFFSELADGVEALLSPRGRAHVDRKAGVVQVTDFAERLEQVGIYIETVTLRATRQVQLSARVLEVTLTDRALIDWAAVAKAAGVTPGAGGGLQVSDLDALLRAIAAFGDVHTVAAPEMLAMNNEPALMRIGSADAGFLSDGDRDARAGRAVGIEPGLTLTITSQISADGIVHMNVSPTLVSAGDRAAPGTGVSVVELDSSVRVRGGETVVIAGLLRDAVDTVSAPGVRGIPGAKDRRTSRVELVVLVTPTIVNAGPPAAGAQ